MTEQHTQPKRRPREWRMLGLTGAALAVIAVVGAATANQALAEDTQRATRPSVSAAATDKTNGSEDKTIGSEDEPTVRTAVSGIAALEAAVSRVVPEGVVSDPSRMNYEPNRDGSPNALGGLTFAPSAAAPSASVGVNYWPAKAGDLQLHSQCNGMVADCETSTLPDGSVVVTYVVPPLTFVPGGDNGPAIAAHRIVNGAVVTLMASAPGKGTDPVLTRDQLVDLISQPEWADLKPAK